MFDIPVCAGADQMDRRFARGRKARRLMLGPEMVRLATAEEEAAAADSYRETFGTEQPDAFLGCFANVVRWRGHDAVWAIATLIWRDDVTCNAVHVVYVHSDGRNYNPPAIEACFQAAEYIARKLGRKNVTFHTARRGMVKQGQDYGYRPLSVLLGKAV